MLASLNNALNRTNISFLGKIFPLKLNIKTVDVPKYGVDFNIGDIGYVTRKKNRRIFDFAIQFFTKRQNTSGVNVSHVLIVKDASTCIEVKGPNGVIETKLSHYLNNTDFDVFFRKPKEMTEEIADKIVRNAQKEEGKKYAYELILNDLIRGTFVGHFIDKITNYNFFDRQSYLIKRKNTSICSELAAKCLQSIQQWPYHNEGILKRPASAINPQQLFEEERIFNPTIIRVHR